MVLLEEEFLFPVVSCSSSGTRSCVRMVEVGVVVGGGLLGGGSGDGDRCGIWKVGDI